MVSLPFHETNSLRKERARRAYLRTKLPASVMEGVPSELPSIE